MRRVNFDLGSAATPGVPGTDLARAQLVVETNQHLLQVPGVVGVWVGGKASTPIIVIAVREHRGHELESKVPDSLDGVNVYYIEGTPYN